LICFTWITFKQIAKPTYRRIKICVGNFFYQNWSICYRILFPVFDFKVRPFLLF
jgi:hypothetical protein